MSIFDRFWGSSKKIDAKPEPQVPVALAAPAPGSAADRRNRKRKNARQGATALIIDDSPTVVAVLRKILRSAGYITRDAGDAEQGLALIAENKPDLIFLDIVLPGMNGFGALRAIRKDPSTQHIPVIMISGNEHATEQFYANRIGADDFMKKPFSRYEVFAHVELLLDANRIPRRKEAPGTVAVPQAVEVREEMVQTLPTPRSAAALAGSASANVGVGLQSALDARKELTAMGLQYFDQVQFRAAVRRGDQLAVGLFVAGGGVALDTVIEGRSVLAIAQERGDTAIIRMLTPAAGR